LQIDTNVILSVVVRSDATE